MRWDVRNLVRGARGAAPLTPVAARARAAELDPATVHGVIELSIRIGEALLSLGAAAADVTRAIHRVLASFGLSDSQIDVTFTSITVAHDPGGTGTPVTVMRVAGNRYADYGRLIRVLELTDRLAADRVAVPDAPARLEQAHGELDAALAAPFPYGPAVVTVVLSVMAAAVALLLGGGPLVAVVAGLTTAVIDRASGRLDRWGLPAFFRQAAGAAIATAVAVLLLVLVPALPVELAGLPPSLVVASGIVVLLAGLSLVGAAEDAISGFPITASGRVFEVVLLTLGIVVGIGAVLDLARRFGITLNVVQDTGGWVPLPVQVVSAGVVAGAWAMSSYARPRAAAVAAAAGASAWLAYSLLSQVNVGPAVASAGAAVLVGFGAEYLAPRLKVAPQVTAACGIVPLLPGLAIYRGLFLLVDERSGSLVAGGQELIGAAMIGLGLASGVTLGELLAAPVRLGTRALHVPRR